MTQHYVQPLEILTRGVPVRQTLKEIASKIRSGRLGTHENIYKYAPLLLLLLLLLMMMMCSFFILINANAIAIAITFTLHLT